MSIDLRTILIAFREKKGRFSRPFPPQFANMFQKICQLIGFFLLSPKCKPIFGGISDEGENISWNVSLVYDSVFELKANPRAPAHDPNLHGGSNSNDSRSR